MSIDATSAATTAAVTKNLLNTIRIGRLLRSAEATRWRGATVPLETIDTGDTRGVIPARTAGGRESALQIRKSTIARGTYPLLPRQIHQAVHHPGPVPAKGAVRTVGMTRKSEDPYADKD